jgi:hypothetical protein
LGFFDRLVGSRQVRIGRSVDILLFELDKESPAGVERFKPHTQCPVRLRRDAAALVGSYDTHRPADDGADRDTAFDTFTTVYDERAREIEAHRRIFPVRVVAVPIRCRAFRRPPCGWD